MSGPSTWFPGLALVRDYDRHRLRRDTIAGLVLSALLVPAGMGYAQAAGLPPVYGLYATVVPLLAYAVVGPSPVFVLGPDSSLAPLIAATVLPLAGADPQRAIGLAAMLAIVAGGFCIAAGLTRFGFLTELLSLPVRYGYLDGIALTVIVSQIPQLLGFRSDGEGVLAGVGGAYRGIADGNVNGWAVLVGGVTLGLVIVSRRRWSNGPGVLIGTLAAIGLVVVLGLDARGLELVGTVPRGLPAPSWPNIRLSDAGALFAGGFGIAMVSFADTSVLSRTFAARRDITVDANQELIALGVANVAGGLFHGFPVSASSSRTPVAESAGACTQVTGVVGALAIAALLVAAPGAFRMLPDAALAAIVIVAATALVELGSVVQLARTRRSEFLLAVVSFVAVVLAGAIIGVVIAVVVSLLVFVAKAWRPRTATLVRVDGLKGYHDAARHPEGRRIPGLVLYRFDAPLFFANAEVFRSLVLAEVDNAVPAARWLVVTAEPITDIDATAAAMLGETRRVLASKGVVLAFAGLKGPVREQLERFGLMTDPIPVFRTVGEAVRTYVTITSVAWTDWEERDEP